MGAAPLAFGALQRPDDVGLYPETETEMAISRRSAGTPNAWAITSRLRIDTQPEPIHSPGAANP